MKKDLLLTIDVGNTRMMFGLYRNDTLICHWQLSSQGYMTGDELALHLHGLLTQHQQNPANIRGIMVASVVPHLDTLLEEACHTVCRIYPAFVGTPEVKTGMAVDYRNPREVGADRIVNAIAARAHAGSPTIVMDCGTATTFDIVSPQGHYAGGLILPGIELSISALAERTAKLPETTFARCDTLIARDTITSIQAGTYWATVDGLDGIIRRLHHLSDYAQAPVIATGGLARLIVEDIAGITEHRPHLTLEGLQQLAHRHFS